MSKRFDPYDLNDIADLDEHIKNYTREKQEVRLNSPGQIVIRGPLGVIPVTEELVAQAGGLEKVEEYLYQHGMVAKQQERINQVKKDRPGLIKVVVLASPDVVERVADVLAGLLGGCGYRVIDKSAPKVPHGEPENRKVYLLAYDKEGDG